MEVQVKELIDKIRNDGIKEAEIKAADIIKEAEAKADEIVSKAKKEAALITAKAKEEALRSEQSGREALKQAGRDLILTLQAKITDLFNAVIKNEVSRAMDDKIMGETIVKLISTWKGDVGNIQVLLPEKDYADLEKNLQAILAEQIKKGMELKSSANLDSGFLLSIKDGSAYYNFSTEGIAEALSEYLNPRLSTLLNEGIRDRTEA